MFKKIITNTSVVLFSIFLLSTLTLAAEKGLVAYWSFDKCNVRDESGNKNNGKLVDIDSSQCVKGIKGKAFNLSKREDHFEVPHNNVFNLKDEYTVSFWIKIDNASRGWKDLDGGWIISNHKAFDHRGWSITCPPGPKHPENYYIRFIPYATDTPPDGYYARSKNLIQRNVFNHVAIVGSQRQNKISIYINGQLDNEYSFPGIIKEDEHPLWIGAHYGIEDRQIDGIVDEIRIYNRALDKEEIEKLYKL